MVDSDTECKKQANQQDTPLINQGLIPLIYQPLGWVETSNETRTV